MINALWRAGPTGTAGAGNGTNPATINEDASAQLAMNSAMISEATGGLAALEQSTEEGAPALLSAGSGSARLPMNMDTVNSVASKYGIDISENDIQINKTVAGLRGSTAPDQSITLYRGAFENEQQLAMTLVHEQYHVEQLQEGMPYPDSYQAGSSWEAAAENFAVEWWNGLNG